MDRETKKYLNRARGVSSDGVPNRKGGSWPNHPSMRYELPIPFSPGADSVTDVYRERHTEIFGESPRFQFCPTCDKSPSWCECPAGSANGRPADSDSARGGSNPSPATLPPRPLCSACGKQGEHRLYPGILTCESDNAVE